MCHARTLSQKNSFDLVKLISQEKPLTWFIHPLERLSIEQPIKGKKLPSRANGISFKLPKARENGFSSVFDWLKGEARVYGTNHRARFGKTNTIADYFRD